MTAAALKRGLLVYPIQGCVDGVAGDHLLIAPPAVITAEQIDWAVGQLQKRSGKPPQSSASVQPAVVGASRPRFPCSTLFYILLSDKPLGQARRLPDCRRYKIRIIFNDLAGDFHLICSLPLVYCLSLGSSVKWLLEGRWRVQWSISVSRQT